MDKRIQKRILVHPRTLRHHGPLRPARPRDTAAETPRTRHHRLHRHQPRPIRCYSALCTYQIHRHHLRPAHPPIPPHIHGRSHRPTTPRRLHAPDSQPTSRHPRHTRRHPPILHRRMALAHPRPRKHTLHCPHGQNALPIGPRHRSHEHRRTMVRNRLRPRTHTPRTLSRNMGIPRA